MRGLVLLVLACASTAQAQVSSPVTFAWDAPSGTVVGYRLYVDGGTPTEWTSTQTAPIAIPPGTHAATVTAFNAEGESMHSMPPLAFTVQPSPDPACAVPLGARAVLIFVTTLQRIGTGGGAFSVARLDFQLASPNSPVTHVAVRTNGGNLATVDGTALTALAGLWFTVPATKGTYVLSVLATNAYGCTTEVLTTKSVSVQ